MCVVPKSSFSLVLALSVSAGAAPRGARRYGMFPSRAPRISAGARVCDRIAVRCRCRRRAPLPASSLRGRSAARRAPGRRGRGERRIGGRCRCRSLCRVPCR